MNLKEIGRESGDRIEMAQYKVQSMGGFYEHSNELSSSLQARNFLTG
jgi:hypothetical protein